MKKIYISVIALLMVFMAKAQFPAPYCNVTFVNGKEPISKVQFAGINNPSPATTSGAVSLEDFLNITGTVEQLGAYTITVEGNSDGNYSNYYRVFFDWNQNGNFDDADEMYEIGLIIGSTGVDGKTAFATINVPASASLGSTRMRVMKQYGNPGTNPNTTPCNSAAPAGLDYGQAEDYTINVTASTACAGTPNAGTVTSNTAIICSASLASVTLNLAGFSFGTGINYQWESSPAGANTWSNVIGGSGATTTTYTSATISASTDFRCKVTCANGGASAYSTAATVTFSNVPANDEACNAIALVLDGATTCGNTTCATNAGDPTFSSSIPNNTVWYKFTPPTTGIYNIVMSRPAGVTTGLLNAWVGIYSAKTACPGLTLFQQTATAGYDLVNNPSVTVATSTLSSDTTYYLMVDGNSGAFGAYCIQMITPPNPPTSCATNTFPANNATNVSYNPSLTLKWTSVANTTSYDVYIGTVNPPTTVLATVITDSIVITGGAANTTYYWYVVPKNNGGSAIGCTANITAFTTAAPPPPPANDDCAGAVSISPYTGAVNATTISATQSLPAILCNGFTGTANDDVWFKFTTLQSGTAIITVTGVGAFDCVVEGFSGTCGALTSIACADDVFSGTEQVETLTLAGLAAATTYYVRVYSWGSAENARGNFSIAASGPASGAALPISLTTFKGEKRSSVNVLSWTTSTETNNAGFELQRSANGINFTQLAYVQSKADNGNSTQATTYSYVDEKPFSGVGYYRLKQIDKDGKFTLSEVVVIKGNKSTKLELVGVYPNPSTNVLNVSLNAPKTDKVTLVVSDLSGRTILSQNVQIVAGDNLTTVNVSALASGTYTIKAICANGCETTITKFVKQ